MGSYGLPNTEPTSEIGPYKDEPFVGIGGD